MTAEPILPPQAFLTPDWPAPSAVRALVTTRLGGVSAGAYAGFNLGARCGDAPEAVAANRRLLRARLPAEPGWMQQVHGAGVRELPAGAGAEADATWTLAWSA